jgi:hypothetical protein
MGSSPRAGVDNCGLDSTGDVRSERKCGVLRSLLMLNTTLLIARCARNVAFKSLLRVARQLSTRERDKT